MIALGSNYTQREHSWSSWKSIRAIKSGVHQFEDDGLLYSIWFYDGPEIHTCQIYKGEVPHGNLDKCSQEENDANKADFESGLKHSANKTLKPTTGDGKSIVSVFPTEGSRTTIVSHSWTDKTTWYQESVRVVNETPELVSSGIYQLGHSYLIDTCHGKLWEEDYLLDSGGYNYRVKVETNSGSGWVTRTEVDAHTEAGDYQVNYVDGVISFLSDVPTDTQIRCTYHYATSSTFTIKPSAGKALKVRSVEVQFSTDIGMTDTVDFTAYGYVDYFAPQYLQSNGGPYPSGTKIPLRNTRYKTMYDFQAESNGALPKIEAIGGNTWRGIKTGVMVFPWDYAAMIPISSAAGMEIRIKLQHDTPFTGEFGTATLYCLSENE